MRARQAWRGKQKRKRRGARIAGPGAVIGGRAERLTGTWSVANRGPMRHLSHLRIWGRKAFHEVLPGAARVLRRRRGVEESAVSGES